MIWRWIWILGLFVHGGIVAAQASGVPKSWLIGDRGHSAGVVLTIVAGLVLLVAGAMLVAHGPMWRTLAVLGACLSLAFFVLFFQPLIILGMSVDIAIIISIGYFAWPTNTMVGA
jgi:uncharacterized membrane protein (UPF0136 family)